jgi:hypothetical protein
VAQVIEQLPSKLEALSSNTSTAKKKGNPEIIFVNQRVSYQLIRKQIITQMTMQ